MHEAASFSLYFFVRDACMLCEEGGRGEGADS